MVLRAILLWIAGAALALGQTKVIGAPVTSGGALGTAAPAQYASITDCTKPGYVYAPSLNTCIQKDGRINVRDYVLAAGGTWAGDITGVMDQVVTASWATGSVVYFPSGNVCWTHQETFLNSFEGDGRYSSIVGPCPGSSANFTSDAPAVARLCIKRSEQGNGVYPILNGGCHIDVRRIGFQGLGTDFPTNLTGSANDIGAYRGIAMKVEESAINTVIEDTQNSRFYRGWELATFSGHVQVRKSDSHGDFCGGDISNNTGDYLLDGDDLTGSAYANLCINGTDNNSLSGGTGNIFSGAGGVIIKGTHFGFAPYGIRVEDGPGNLGLLSFSMEKCPFENVGNEFVYIGHNTNAGPGNYRAVGGFNLVNSGGTWWTTAAGGQNFQIAGNTSFPAQQYAMELDFMQSPSKFDEGSAFPVGTSGNIGLIRTPQADLLVSDLYTAQHWVGSDGTATADGTVKTAHASGVVEANTTANAHAMAAYAGNVSGNGAYQDVQPTACSYSVSGDYSQATFFCQEIRAYDNVTANHFNAAIDIQAQHFTGIDADGVGHFTLIRSQNTDNNQYQINLYTPPTSTSNCDQGQIAKDASYNYFCFATNRWKRTAWSADVW